MNVSLTPRLEAFVREKVETGLSNNASEVVRETLRLLDERDREQRLREELAIGLAQIERGEGLLLTEELVDKIKRESTARAAAGRPFTDAVVP